VSFAVIFFRSDPYSKATSWNDKLAHAALKSVPAAVLAFCIKALRGLEWSSVENEARKRRETGGFKAYMNYTTLAMVFFAGGDFCLHLDHVGTDEIEKAHWFMVGLFSFLMGHWILVMFLYERSKQIRI